MYLLYLDESGNESDPKDTYFVLAGISLFERQSYFLASELDKIQQKHFPGRPPVAFHASEIRAGRNFWRKVSEEQRREVLDDIVAAILNSPDRGRFLYAAAIEKTNVLYGEGAVERATEEVCRRFDVFLTRKYQNDGDPQRGLLIFSEGRFHERARLWVTGFRERGTQWGAINNLADIPYFASMQATRLLQAADFIAHAVWLLYEKRDASLIRLLVPAFDSSNGILHGLVHVRGGAGPCDCPACFTRRTNGRNAGPWL